MPGVRLNICLQESLHGELSDAVRLSDSMCSTSGEWGNQYDTEAITNAFDHLAGEDGLLGLEQLSTLLQDVGLQAPSDVVLGLVESLSTTDWALNLGETCVQQHDLMHHLNFDSAT